MKFIVWSLFPELINSLKTDGVIGRSLTNGTSELETVNIRDYGLGTHRQVDDAPYGGDDGMVMRCEPLFKCIQESFDKFGKGHVIYLSPSAPVFTHSKAVEISQKFCPIYFLCGRYAGIDQRVIDTFVDEQISIGDYVISGGELAAMVCIDAISRQIPGVLGNEVSASADSFSNGLLEYPIYTRPATYNGMDVPPVLLNGNHQHIENWKYEESLKRTKSIRPDLLTKRISKP